jgi:hypothetical protein
VGVSSGTGFTQQLWTCWYAGPGFTWQDVQVGDFNHDGKADLVARTPDGRVFVALTNASGTGFTPQTQWACWYAGPGFSWLDVRVGDFNGDGKLDLEARTPDGKVFVALGNGSSCFAPQTLWACWYAGPGFAWQDVQVGDFNHDGKADLVARTPDGHVFVALTNAAGTGFAPQTLWATWYAGPGFAWLDVLVGDFNGDGNLDLLARTPAGRIFLALGNGSTRFAPQTVWNS